MNDEVEELLKVNDIWSYFDTDSVRNKARCLVCKANLDNEYEELKAHLKDSHPNLLLQIMQDKEERSDAASNDADDDNDNTYTEVVYLEQEPLTDTIIKQKEKPKLFSRAARKRERFQSSDEVPVKKAKDDDIHELGAFITYITCLLKKLPADAFSNVQIEIINTILRANSQANIKSIVTNQDQGSTSSNTSNLITVDEITPVNKTVLGHNYTITVAPKENESENT